MISPERLKELKELKDKSTKVTAWYPHGKFDQSGADCATVRGPFGRWLTVHGGADYPKDVAEVEDDARYAAAAMSELPELIDQIERAQVLVDALEFYEKRDGCLPIEISPAREALAKWSSEV